MKICMMCNKPCKNLLGLSSHISKVHNVNTKYYFDKFLLKNNANKCLVCKKDNKFIGLGLGYQKHCSYSCSTKNPITREKQKKTMLIKYGVEHNSKSEESNNKKKQTCLERYNVEYSTQSKIMKSKSKQTWLKRYGVENPSQMNDFAEKSKKTFLKNYGVDNPMKLEVIKEKTKQTCLDRYGVDCIGKSKFISHKTSETNRKIFYNKLLNSDRLKDLVTPSFNSKEYKGTLNYSIYSWKCTKCKTEFEDNINNGKIPRCPTCYPKLVSGTSQAEQEVLEFVKQYYPNVENPNRTILDGKHIDIYIPEIKLGVEYNGLYWHSELAGNKEPRYHQNKTLLAKEKGIQLIQIFEDEWFNKQDIVKSIILNKMSKSPVKIYARKCIIKSVENKEAKQFLFDNHLQSEINGIHIGLYFESELVSMITMGKSRFNKSIDYEILRFCNKLNTSVTGGLSKLLKHFKKLNPNSSIITYADARYGEGKGYESCGFKFKELTNPNYFYLENNSRESRMKYQKYKLDKLLEVFDSTLTEWQNMQLNGFDRIWDCGNYKYEWRL